MGVQGDGWRNAEVHRGVRGGAQGCTEVCMAVHGGAQRRPEACMEVCIEAYTMRYHTLGIVHRGARKCRVASRSMMF